MARLRVPREPVRWDDTRTITLDSNGAGTFNIHPPGGLLTWVATNISVDTIQSSTLSVQIVADAMPVAAENTAGSFYVSGVECQNSIQIILSGGTGGDLASLYLTGHGAEGRVARGRVTINSKRDAGVGGASQSLLLASAQVIPADTASHTLLSPPGGASQQYRIFHADAWVAGVSCAATPGGGGIAITGLPSTLVIPGPRWAVFLPAAPVGTIQGGSIDFPGGIVAAGALAVALSAPSGIDPTGVITANVTWALEAA